MIRLVVGWKSTTAATAAAAATTTTEPMTTAMTTPTPAVSEATGVLRWLAVAVLAGQAVAAVVARFVAAAAAATTSAAQVTGGVVDALTSSAAAVDALLAGLQSAGPPTNQDPASEDTAPRDTQRPPPAAAGDGCGDFRVRFGADGGCYALLKPGPCPSLLQWLTVDPANFTVSQAPFIHSPLLATDFKSISLTFMKELSDQETWKSIMNRLLFFFKLAIERIRMYTENRNSQARLG